MANPDCLFHTALGIDIIATVKLNELGFRYLLAPRRHLSQHIKEGINLLQPLLHPVLTPQPLNNLNNLEFSHIRMEQVQQTIGLSRDADLLVEARAIHYHL